MVCAKRRRKERCKGNDDTETEVGNAQADCAEQRPQAAGVEEAEGGCGMIGHNAAILCPECGAELGRYVLDSVMHTALGSIPAYNTEIDYTKAAHIGIKGTLCRECARKLFPEGVAYKVTIQYVHSRMNVTRGGVKNSGWYATREEAQAKADEMDRRCATNYARVEELKY